MVGCMRCFQLSENYVVFYVCHKSTSVFVSSVGSYCRVVFEVRCSMSGFSFVSWIVMMFIFVLSARFFSSCIFLVSPLMFICIIVMVFLEFICCWVLLLLIECSVEHMSQVLVWVDGPGFVSTSPDRARSSASHMRGSMGRLTEKNG